MCDKAIARKHGSIPSKSMPYQYEIQQRRRLVELYTLSESYKHTRMQFLKEFPGATFPARSAWEAVGQSPQTSTRR